MALELTYHMFAKVLSWMVLHVRSDTGNEIEILVLRHQPGRPSARHRIQLVSLGGPTDL